MPKADILANALSNQWNYTTKPYEPKFIELFIDSDRAYIIGTAFLLWTYIKSLKENTFDGKTYMPGFLCSLAKYGLVAPTLVILALSAFILSVCG